MRNKIYPLFSSLVLCLLLAFPGTAQFENHSFQWRYEYAERGDMRNFDVLPLPDHGYLMGGIMAVDSGSALHFPYIFRVDCQGNVLWSRVFNQPTEGANNISTRVLALSQNEFALVSNVGFYFTTPYNDIFAARLDAEGNTVWARRIGGGAAGFDVANDAVATADGGIVVAGQSSSFGTDKGSNVYTDQYFLKLDAAGQIAWTRTVGNKQAVDRAYDIAELPDGSLVAAGSYLFTGGTFHANLLKLDKNGNLLWHKAFGEGDAPQANHAYGVLPTSDGGFLVTGSTTNLGSNFTAYPDFLVVKTDGDGNAQWTRAVAGGGPDLFENASNAIEKANGDFVICGATAPSPSAGFVPNKHVLITISPAGDLLAARSINGGSSHYPRIVGEPSENSVLVTGFTNWNSYGGNNIRFDPILANLNANFTINNCFSMNYTSLTTIADPVFEFGDPPATLETGGALLNNIINSAPFELSLINVCEQNGFADCAPFTPVQTAPVLTSDFEIFPNPASVQRPVSLRWPAGTRVQKIAVFDASGRQVADLEPIGKLSTLDFRLDRAGIYVVQWQTDAGVFSEKLILN